VVVQRITGSTTLRVECLARSILMNQVTRTRVFRNVRRSDVARQLAREAGFDGESLDIEESPVVYPTINQAGRTDAQLLTRLARQEGFYFYVDQDGFHFHQRRVGQPPVRVLEYFTSHRGDILDFNIENDITARPGRTRARGRDPLEGTDIDVQADDSSDAERETLAPIRVVVDPETRQTRIEAEAGSEETRPTSAPDVETARRGARARFRRVQQTAVKMTMNIVGDPLLLAKTVVEVRGMGQRLSGRYYVRKVSHKIGSGYTCSLNLISDGDGGHSTASRAARGLELFESGPPTSGRPNTAPPVEGAEEGGTQEGAPLEQVLVVDQETRATRIEYRDTRPRGGATTAPRSEE
jgi:phage protein D